MDLLPTEVIANIIRFLQLDEKHVVLTVNKKWHDAASFAIRHEERLDLTSKRKNKSMLKMIANAFRQNRLPDLNAVKYLKIKEPKSPDGQAAVAAVLQKTCSTVQHMTIFYRQMSQKKWLTVVFDHHVFSELRSLRTSHIPVEVVPTMLTVCPKLVSFDAYQHKLLPLLPAGTRELKIEGLKREMPHRQISRFKELRRLTIRNCRLRPARSFFAGFALLLELEVSCSFCISDNLLKNLVQECPVLQKLTLCNRSDTLFVHSDNSRCTLTGLSIDHLNNMQSLEYVRIESLQWVGDLSHCERLLMDRGGRKRLKVCLVREKSDSFPFVGKWFGDGTFHVNIHKGFTKAQLWNIFTRVKSVRKLSLVTARGVSAQEDAATVVCAMFRHSLQELVLSGFKLTDDALCIFSSLKKLEKLMITNCQCNFSAPPLINFLSTMTTGDGPLKDLTIGMKHFTFTTEQVQTFRQLLGRFEYDHIYFTMNCPMDELDVGDYISLTNFEDFIVVDDELRKTEGEEFVSSQLNSSRDPPRVPPFKQTRKLLSERKILLDKLLMAHTTLTEVNVGWYCASLKYIIQNRELTDLEFGAVIDDNDMIALSGLQHLERLTLTSVLPVKVTAAGIMLLLMGKSSHCIDRIAFKTKFGKKLTQDGLLSVRNEVVRINASRAKKEDWLVLNLGEEYHDAFAGDEDEEISDDDVQALII